MPLLSGSRHPKSGSEQGLFGPPTDLMSMSTEGAVAYSYASNTWKRQNPKPLNSTAPEAKTSKDQHPPEILVTAINLNPSANTT